LRSPPYAIWRSGQGIPADLLSRLFDHGDTACKVAVCLREDLTSDLKNKCRNASHHDVREHFLTRQASSHGKTGRAVEFMSVSLPFVPLAVEVGRV
jgi:hypothetical protein